jgi:hypothetical protein
MEEGRFVVTRFALHFGMRLRGGVFGAVCSLGLQCGGPLALGVVLRWRGLFARICVNARFGRKVIQ